MLILPDNYNNAVDCFSPQAPGLAGWNHSYTGDGPTLVNSVPRFDDGLTQEVGKILPGWEHQISDNQQHHPTLRINPNPTMHPLMLREPSQQRISDESDAPGIFDFSIMGGVYKQVIYYHPDDELTITQRFNMPPQSMGGVKSGGRPAADYLFMIPSNQDCCPAGYEFGLDTDHDTPWNMVNFHDTINHALIRCWYARAITTHRQQVKDRVGFFGNEFGKHNLPFAHDVWGHRRQGNFGNQGAMFKVMTDDCYLSCIKFVGDVNAPKMTVINPRAVDREEVAQAQSRGQSQDAHGRPSLPDDVPEPPPHPGPNPGYYEIDRADQIARVLFNDMNNGTVVPRRTDNHYLWSTHSDVNVAGGGVLQQGRIYKLDSTSITLETCARDTYIHEICW